MSSTGVHGTDHTIESGALDRLLTIPRLNWVQIGGILLLFGGTIVRLAGLDRWAVTPGESEIALAASAIVNGASHDNDLAGSPFTALLTAGGMFIGDSTETVGRVTMALVGILAFCAALRIQRGIGSTAALVSAGVLATSPTLIALSRTIDSGIVIIGGLFVSLAIATSTRARWSRSRATFLGLTLGAICLAGPLGPVAVLLLLLFLAMMASRDELLATIGDVIPILTGFAISLVVISTVFLTRPGDAPGAVAAVFDRLWSAYISDAGSSIHLPLWNLVLNEPLVVVLAICGLIWNRAHPWALPSMVWALAAFAIVSLLGDPGPAGYGLTVAPLAVLGGLGAVVIVSELASRGYPARYPAIVFILALLVLVLALLGISASSTGDDDSVIVNVIQFLLILLIGVLPAGIVLATVGQRLRGFRIVLAVVALLSVVSIFTVRTAVLTAAARPANPNEILYSRAMSEGLPVVVDSLHKISRDIT
ncbi:MAG: hypothetical protein ACOC9Y_00825, partial [Chloroflexota bacterium]